MHPYTYVHIGYIPYDSQMLKFNLPLSDMGHLYNIPGVLKVCGDMCVYICIYVCFYVCMYVHVVGMYIEGICR